MCLRIVLAVCMFLDFDQELELDEGIRGEHIQKGEEEEVKEQGC